MSAAASHLHLIAREAESRGPSDAIASLDDTELLTALRVGDPGAASALHDRTRGVVERTVRRLLGPNDFDYEDLCQLAFIELVNTIGRFRGECPLDAWVSVVSARVVYKHLRRRKVERKIFSRMSLQVMPDIAPAPRHNSVLRDLLRRVNEHFKRVDEKHALTFLLHDAFGYDVSEVASITGVSTSAAQSRLVRGRRELHERIARDPGLARALDDLSDPGDA
ncbi:MAG TPA: sigma-70 family RNA polymerase sigma factor [Polyangiaceae bacterium]